MSIEVELKRIADALEGIIVLANKPAKAEKVKKAKPEEEVVFRPGSVRVSRHEGLVNPEAEVEPVTGVIEPDVFAKEPVEAPACTIAAPLISTVKSAEELRLLGQSLAGKIPVDNLPAFSAFVKTDICGKYLVAKLGLIPEKFLAAAEDKLRTKAVELGWKA